MTMFGLYGERSKQYVYSSSIAITLLAAEFVVVVSAFKLWKGSLIAYVSDSQHYAMLALIVALCWALSNWTTGAYKVEDHQSVRRIVRVTLLCALVNAVLMTIALGTVGSGVPTWPLVLWSAVLLCALFLPLRVIAYKIILHMMRTSGRGRKAVILGHTLRAKELNNHFAESESIPFKYLGFFSEGTPSDENVNFCLGSIGDAQLFCLRESVSEIYYALDNRPDVFEEFVRFTDKHFIFLGVVPDMKGIDLGRRVGTLVYNDSKIPVIASRKLPLHLFANYQVKRLFDIFFALGTLLVLSLMVFPVIAMAIKLSSPGPVFFRQQRPGKKNKLFWCYKFRTMTVNNEPECQATKNDLRVTKVGAFLRRTSLDELPQFFNVLMGDMSVVGPRPNLVSHLQNYPQYINEYALRHWVTPGITGLAQVSGYRGETREVIQMQKRVEHDLLYIERWSLSFDLEIIGRTMLNMIRGEKAAY